MHQIFHERQENLRFTEHLFAAAAASGSFVKELNDKP
jgi:hypothetical protein